MVASRKDDLVDTALDLFYQNGFHATGVDRILAAAGVAKMTLYKHFRSKDALIVAALERRDARFREWFRASVEARARAPRKRLLAVFDTLADWFDAAGFQGCMFINAAAEFGQGDHPIHGVAAAHKAAMRDYYKELAAAAGADDPDDLAEQIALLVEGATVIAHVSGDGDAARRARRAAKALVKNAGL